MNNINKKRTAPKRMRRLATKSKTFKPVHRAAIAAGALTLSIMLTACGEAEAKPPVGSSSATDITATAPEQDGTHESVRYEETEFETVYIDDPEAYEDEEEIIEEGAPGKVQVKVFEVWLGGELTAVREERITVSEPQNRVIKRGTKPILHFEENTVTETLEKYSTIYEECDTMEVGTKKLKTEGKDSVSVRTYKYTYIKGELTHKELVSEQVTERVDEVILVGTKKVQQTFGMPFIDASHGGVNYKLTQSYGGSNNHLGLDFAVYYGDPIIAVMDGTVIEAYDEGYFSKNNILWTYGTYVVIQHDGYRTYYAHLRTRNVSVGDKVKKGDIIGTSGNTGRINTSATGPYAGTHLHFEIRKYYPAKKVYHTVDPKLYLPWWN